MDITTNTHPEPERIHTFFFTVRSFYGIPVRIQTQNRQIVSLVSLKKEIHWSEPEQLLSTAERNYCKRFRYPKRRNEWLGGRTAAKAALLPLPVFQGVQDEADRLTILPDEHGRPILEEPFGRAKTENIALSITHSGEYAAAFAIQGLSFCGIDLQKISAKLPDLTNHFTTAAELDMLECRPELGDRETALTMLWAAKESLKKSLLSDQSVIFSGVEVKQIIPADKQVWQFRCAVQGYPDQQTATVYNLAPYILSLTCRDA